MVLAVGGSELAAWSLTGSAHPDLSVIDTLARLALAARHVGGAIALRNAGPGLLALIDFVGLDDVLGADDVPRQRLNRPCYAPAAEPNEPEGGGR